MNVSRRISSRAVSGAAGTALADGILIEGARVDANTAITEAPVTEVSFPFHGPRQAGVLTPPRPTSIRSPASPPSTAPRRAGPGRRPDTLAVGPGPVPHHRRCPARPRHRPPPSDGDVLGHVVPADGLTVTLSVGSSPCRPPLHRLPPGRPAAVRNWAAAADQRAARRLRAAVRRRVLLHLTGCSTRPTGTAGPRSADLRTRGPGLPGRLLARHGGGAAGAAQADGPDGDQQQPGGQRGQPLR